MERILRRRRVVRFGIFCIRWEKIGGANLISLKINLSFLGYRILVISLEIL